ncbi:conserved Plasmodium protein, unknown function [Plasmodium gaboni]|uniref:Uncharacterized protein n=1 Tax=Plasmodium gaboni TaxID=647221 RepID=A0ABY1UP25_9APIC|nr:conserved Plasmodium protein, unknown function [Plasmodium gaboni]
MNEDSVCSFSSVTDDIDVDDDDSSFKNQKILEKGGLYEEKEGAKNWFAVENIKLRNKLKKIKYKYEKLQRNLNRKYELLKNKQDNVRNENLYVEIDKLLKKRRKGKTYKNSYIQTDITFLNNRFITWDSYFEDSEIKKCSSDGDIEILKKRRLSKNISAIKFTNAFKHITKKFNFNERYKKKKENKNLYHIPDGNKDYYISIKDINTNNNINDNNIFNHVKEYINERNDFIYKNHEIHKNQFLYNFYTNDDIIYIKQITEKSSNVLKDIKLKNNVHNNYNKLKETTHHYINNNTDYYTNKQTNQINNTLYNKQHDQFIIKNNHNVNISENIQKDKKYIKNQHNNNHFINNKDNINSNTITNEQTKKEENNTKKKKKKKKKKNFPIQFNTTNIHNHHNLSCNKFNIKKNKQTYKDVLLKNIKMKLNQTCNNIVKVNENYSDHNKQIQCIKKTPENFQAQNLKHSYSTFQFLKNPHKQNETNNNHSNTIHNDNIDHHMNNKNYLTTNEILSKEKKKKNIFNSQKFFIENIYLKQNELQSQLRNQQKEKNYISQQECEKYPHDYKDEKYPHDNIDQSALLTNNQITPHIKNVQKKKRKKDNSITNSNKEDSNYNEHINNNSYYNLFNIDDSDIILNENNFVFNNIDKSIEDIKKISLQYKKKAFLFYL